MADPWGYLTDEQRAWLFTHFTPEQLEWSMKSRGLDVTCEDPATLKRAARAHVRAILAAEHDPAA